MSNSKSINIKLNDGISWLAWGGVFLTLCTLVGVFLNLSNVVRSTIFNSYHPLQLIVSATMFIWALKFLLSEDKNGKLVYTSICMCISLCSLFFIMMGIY